MSIHNSPLPKSFLSKIWFTIRWLTAKRPYKTRVTISLKDHSDVEILKTLRAAIRTFPETLELEIINGTEISPDSALMLFELLNEVKSEQTTLVTVSRTHLLNGSLLIWLAGDERGSATHASAQLQSLPVFEKELEDNWEFSERNSDRELLMKDHQKVIELIQQIAPEIQLDQKIEMSDLELQSRGLLPRKTLGGVEALGFRPPRNGNGLSINRNLA